MAGLLVNWFTGLFRYFGEEEEAEAEAEEEEELKVAPYSFNSMYT